MILYYEQVKNLSISQLKEYITTNKKKRIRDIKLLDFLESERSLIGVYLFFDANDCPVYVGKTGSRAILERFAAHYDLRPIGFMNSFLSSLSGYRMGGKLPRASEDDLRNAYKMSLDYKLLFVELERKEQINTLEKILAREYQPRLNSVKGKKPYNIDTIVENL